MMEESKLISVIIPVYKVQKYLERCIQSVLSQTYQNLEILLVDDGSPDESGRMCDEYAKQDSRIKVIHKQNGGLSSARNAALRVATGAYISFVDGDDYISHRMLEKLYYAAVEYQAQVVICKHFTEQNGRISIREQILDEVVVYSTEDALRALIEDKEINNYAWDKLYASELFQNISYPEDRNYEDIATTYLLFEKASRIVQIPEYLYYYQLREGSISSHKDEYKWYKNCCQIIESNIERYTYLYEHGYKEIGDLAFANTLPYVYEAVKRAHQFQDMCRLSDLEKYLKVHTEQILSSKLVSEKDKQVLAFYSQRKKYTLYQKSKPIFRKINSIKSKAERALCADYDFSLQQGKNVRYVLFELPCFDNLGDHAIAYAQQKILEKIIETKSEVQLYVVDGWDTARAVNSLKRVIGPNDCIFCQGGGNLGNLYDFAQKFRKTVFSAFPDTKLYVFPQTMYFTDNEEGRKELLRTERLFSKCKKLTLMARDQKSYQMMKTSFSKNNVRIMPDVVSYLDASDYAKEERNGILFCIRSDKESIMNVQEHESLLSCCEKIYQDVQVTDTCEITDITREMREERLIKKWKLFGSKRLVVTDRLHGMIFSMITKTPCIILGNNHHKVEETYKIFQECEYLHFAGSVEEAMCMVEKVYVKPLSSEKYSVGFPEAWNEMFRV